LNCYRKKLTGREQPGTNWHPLLSLLLYPISPKQDNVDVEHDYGDERDDELTFDTSHEGAEYESVRTSTSRNKPIIHHNNIPYLFHQLSKNGLVKFWRCEAFSGPEIKCKGLFI